MLKYLLVAILFSSVAAQANKFYSCSWILGSWINCNQFPDEETCGTDKVTYKNKCEFSQAHCRDGSIDLQSTGPCSSLTINPGSTLPTPVIGAEVIFDFLCTRLSHDDCPAELSPVCGSDGYTYQNYCEFEKAKCTHRDLHARTFADCQA